MPVRSVRRRRPQQLRAQQTVEAVLGAVARVLKRHGPAGVNTNEIARIAGISIGSLYQYFPDKYAIFAALRDRHTEAMARLVETELVAAASLGLEDVMRRLIAAMIEAHALDPALHALLLHQLPPGADSDRMFEERVHNALRLALTARKDELRQPIAYERILFVTTRMLEALAHGVVLQRPAALSMEAAKSEALQAIMAYLHGHMLQPRRTRKRRAAAHQR